MQPEIASDATTRAGCQQMSSVRASVVRYHLMAVYASCSPSVELCFSLHLLPYVLFALSIVS